MDNYQQPPAPFYVPSYLPMDQWRFDTEKILDDFRHKLKGEIRTAEGTWIKTGNELLSQEGIEIVISHLMPVINSNTLMSNLSKDEIYSMAETASVELADSFYMSREKYGIDLPMYSIIVDEIANFIFITLKRAMDGLERQALTMTIEEKRFVSENTKDKGGFKIPDIFGRNKDERPKGYYV